MARGWWCVLKHAQRGGQQPHLLQLADSRLLTRALPHPRCPLAQQGSYQWGSLPAPYPALNATEVDAFCDGENAVQAAAHEWLFANGGMDGQACWTYITAWPQPGDTPAACAAKLHAADETASGMPVGFAMDRTGQRGWNDSTAPAAVASFLLTRKAYWFFGAGGNGVSAFTEGTAALLLSDYGAPLANMTSSGDVFSREYERATVTLDCSKIAASVRLRDGA